jgi:hypothetical protein
MKKSPLARVNEEFGSKDKLVDAIVGVLERGDEDKDALRKRLLAASNSKLFRLLDLANQVKQAGGRSKLIDALLETSRRGKDKDFRARLEGLTTGRLLDLYRVASRKQKAAAAPAPAPKRGRRGKGKAA